MTPAEIEALLAEPRIAVLGMGRDEAGPLLAPIWYRYDPDDGFCFNMGGSSAKATRLRAEGRGTVCVHADDNPYRYVIAEGPVTVTLLGDDTFESVRAMASRYLGDKAGLRYAEQFAVTDEVVVRLTVERLQAIIV
jgi:PPOX class probable F420-dependent enzyme